MCRGLAAHQFGGIFFGKIPYKVALVHVYVDCAGSWKVCVCRHFTSEFPYKGDDDDAVGDAFDWWCGGEGWHSIYYVLVI